MVLNMLALIRKMCADLKLSLTDLECSMENDRAEW